MTHIQPIQTQYKGYLFRSRLEARWAVFFDTQCIAWEYEKEGFELSESDFDGNVVRTIRYLPDFWLPRVRMWAEVKPEKFSPKETDKCSLLARESGHPCLMLAGLPDFVPYWAREGGYGAEGEPEECDYLLDVEPYYLSENRFYACPGWAANADSFSDTYRRAVAASRSAHFEFGARL